MTTFWITLLTTILFVGVANGQSRKKYPQTEATIIINTTVNTAFNYIVPIDLSHIFKKYKRFPAIIKTDEKELWIKPGLTRTVYFEDGTTAKESLLTVVEGDSFSYQIVGFTSQLRFLAKKVEGSWKFTELENRQTKIEWTYRIIPKNFVARFIIKSFILKDINGLLNNALFIIKKDLENGK
ncbi:hypothetical protein [Flavobacterium sp.]|uniref:hypothetical protein n=1 Tax=Flavobacterium sp. TaxID=239 RepID=UPI002620A1A4|nr:hypothetical protein [Flavobacterium sp.]